MALFTAENPFPHSDWATLLDSSPQAEAAGPILTVTY